VSRAGLTHDDYVRAVTDFIEQRDLRDVILVGHSFGGSVVSRVSQEIPDRLKRLVFHTAFVVEDGASVNDKPEPANRGTFLPSTGPTGSLMCPGMRIARLSSPHPHHPLPRQPVAKRSAPRWPARSAAG
jgi:pimeloyl-ACP methyl ester carboxylesterase